MDYSIFNQDTRKERPEPKIGEEFVLSEQCPVCGKPVVGIWGRDHIEHDCGITYHLTEKPNTSLSDSFNDVNLKGN